MRINIMVSFDFIKILHMHSPKKSKMTISFNKILEYKT